jgi:hypothetical protein
VDSVCVVATSLATGEPVAFVAGGTRLNSPIKPALHLGADRVILIGPLPQPGRRRV